MNFVIINKRTMKFKSKMTNYKYEEKIPSKAKDTIIVTINSENIHPAIWKSEWFKDEIEAEKYISNIRKSYTRNL